MDLFWLENAPVLHIVCTPTHFGNAMWIPSKSAKDIWLTFLHCWSTVYLGHPKKIQSDRKSSVNSKMFHNLALSNSIALQLSPVEAQKAIGAGEQYYAPLRRIYLVLQWSHSTLTPQLTLRLAVKGINDTMGPERLVPLLFVFGVIPSLPLQNKPLTTQ